MAGRFFKLSKLQAMSKGKIGRYLLYALGEIVLVVAGILIALAINNANEQKKERDELLAIFSDVKADLVIDTTLVGRIIPYYEAREKLADSISKGFFSREDYNRCLPCHSMITTYVPFKLNDKGYSQLRNFNQSNENKDSLAVEIVQFYNGFINIIDEISSRVEEDTYSTLEQWRNTQPWFADILSGKLPEAYLDYISEDPEYRNRVAYFNVIACKNLLPVLRQYKTQAEEALKRLDERLVPNDQKS